MYAPNIPKGRLVFLPVLQKQKPKLSSVLRHPRNTQPAGMPRQGSELEPEPLWRPLRAEAPDSCVLRVSLILFLLNLAKFFRVCSFEGISVGLLSLYSLSLSSSDPSLFFFKRTKASPREASQVLVWDCHILEKL